MDRLTNTTDTSNEPRPEFGGRTSMEWVKLPQADQAAITRAYNAQLVREQRERVMALQVKIDQDRKAREDSAAAEADAQRRARLEADVKRSFIAAGGTEVEFDEVGDRLVLQHLEAVTKDRMERDRAAMRSRIGRMI